MKKIRFSFNKLFEPSGLGIKFVVLLCIALFSTDLLFAPPPRPDPNIPIDGGIGFLIAAGIGYGAKKAFGSRKKKNKDL